MTRMLKHCHSETKPRCVSGNPQRSLVACDVDVGVV